MFRASLAIGFLAAAIAGLVLIVPAWLAAPRVYDQSTPDAVVSSFADMIEAGEADRIPELLFAENEPMRLALGRLGRLIGELTLLAETVATTMPEDVERLRGEAREAAERGEASSLLGRVTQAATQQRRSRRDGNESRGEALNRLVRQLLAQPLGSFGEARGRLTTVQLGDTTAGLLWDGAPVLPPFGVSMILNETDQKWYIVLPLDLPIVSQYRPRTQGQWETVAYLFRAWENVARDLRLKIERGEIRSLDEAASEAGPMVLPPTMMIGVAYAKQIEAAKDAEQFPDTDAGG